jgi:putative methionine-R-sulfoxide reductase with GAF domain
VPLVVRASAPGGGRVLAVLDVDSDHPAAFDSVDAEHLQELCSWLAATYGPALTAVPPA